MFFSDPTTLYRRQIKDEWYIHAYRFEIVVGLRPGELIGLKRADIRNGVCSISRAVNIDKDVTAGKNDNARRVFVLPQLALQILKKQYAMLDAASVASPWIFPAPDGAPTVEKNYYRSLKRYEAYHELPSCSLYELRHTFFSANKQIPEELIKIIGGHSDSFDTYGTYSHEMNGDALEAARLIDETMYNILSTHEINFDV